MADKKLTDEEVKASNDFITLLKNNPKVAEEFDRFKSEKIYAEKCFFINWDINIADELKKQCIFYNKKVISVLRAQAKPHGIKTFKYISFSEMRKVFVEGTMNISDLKFVPSKFAPAKEEKFIHISRISEKAKEFGAARKEFADSLGIWDIIETSRTKEV